MFESTLLEIDAIALDAVPYREAFMIDPEKLVKQKSDKDAEIGYDCVDKMTLPVTFSTPTRKISFNPKLRLSYPLMLVIKVSWFGYTKWCIL